jgi:hypothetical protein
MNDVPGHVCTMSQDITLARHEGFEPPTARSVVGHPSPLVTLGVVAMWSQFRPIVARPDVW